jgi:hypothetical protein
MTTNLIASIVISLVTNVTERFPTHPEPYTPDFGGKPHYTLEAYIRYVPDENPSVKWVRTTVKRVEKWQWEGETLRTKEEIVSDVEVEHKRLEAWAPVATNDVPRQAYLLGGGISYLTNYASTNLFLRMTNEVVWVTYTNGASK